MTVKNYDPASVTVIIGGAPISGFADGTYITAARNNQSFNLVVGSDGEGARAKSNDRSGTITLTLLQSSASNDILSALSNLDEATGNGVGPVMIKDNLGSTLLLAETGWVKKPADVEFAREITGRAWEIETNDLNMFVGGSQTA